MAEIYSIPDNSNSGTDAATLLAASALAGNGGGFGGFGANPMALAFMFPFIMPFVLPFMNMMYGGNFGGFGGFGGANAGFISNQLNNDAGRELIMQAIQGNQNAISQLASLLNTTHDQIQQGINTLNTSILSVGNNVGMTGLQIINAMQSGDNAIQSSIAQGLAGILAQMNANSKDEAMAHCQQTYNLTEAMNRNYLALDNKIDAMESSRKDRELAAKDAEIATLKSQNFTAGVIAQNLAPVNAALASLNKEVDDIKCKLPNTINVEYPQVSVVNTTPFMGGVVYPYAQGGYGGYYGGGF